LSALWSAFLFDEPTAAILLLLSSFFTSALSAVISLAGGTILLALMSFSLPLSQVIPLHAVIQLGSNAGRSFLLRSSIIMPYFWSFVLGSTIGNIVSVAVISHLHQWESSFSILIVVMIFYTLFKPKKMPSLNPGATGFAFVGLFIGFLGMFVGATGTLLGAFFPRDQWNKEQLVATQGSMQTFNHLSKVVGFCYLGFNFIPWLGFLLLMVLCGFLGTSLGVKWLKLLPEGWFKKFYELLLFAGALKILWDWCSHHLYFA
jgi:uncharacterized protein